ncbi:cache domain-containing protein [Marinobacter nitratireducens]|nr:cache domain-containing protein [Marinobacter nitratireducens]
MPSPQLEREFWRRKAKLTLLFLVVFSACLFLLALMMTPIRSSHEQRIKAELVSNHNQILELTELTLQQRMLQMARDVRFLASLENLIPEDTSAPIPEDSDLANIFTRLVELNPAYDQVRLLRTDGQEILRADRANEGARLVPASELQNKLLRYYVTAAARTPTGQVYFSPLDLNIEHGEIERPLKPVIRVAVKVLTDTPDSDLILVINYSANALLSQIRGLFAAGPSQKSMLVSQDGYWIVAPDPKWEWGAQLGNEAHRLQNYDPDLWRTMLNARSGKMESPEKIYTFRQVFPFHQVPELGGENGGASQTYWYIISEIDQSAWHGKSFVEGRAGQLTVLVLIALSAVVSLAFTLLIAERRED